MKAQFLRFAERLRESYWFLPSVMAFAAVLLAGGMIMLDSYEGSAWMDGFTWLYASRPDGARQVLSSIGGSMITVAGTVFSVTIAAVVYASGQYGPRLLSNFMSDRGNQVTLGTFIATFLYCLLVLRTIRSPEESGGVGFVPNMALLVGVLLALCSIAVLIFFIHHVPSKIHINSVIEDVGDRLLHEIDHRFPTFIGSPRPHRDDHSENARVPATFSAQASAEDAGRRMLINAKATGYVQIVDDGTLMESARAANLVLRLQYQPGDFIHKGRTLVEAWPPERCDEEVGRSIVNAFTVGSRRSALQDLRFLIDELVEIAARALSPGVNDPFTAVTCIDWLSAALSDLAPRKLPSHLRVDEDGALRVIAHPVTFEGLLDRSFGALAQYAAADMVAALRYLRGLGEVALDCDDPARLAALDDYAFKLEELAIEALGGFNLVRVRERADELRRALREPDYKRRLRDSTAWLGGTS
ncbi:DUF2254 domain-containing protein [Sphingomonas montanisoli]|uniref:DUF2254 domain-containing protein n=1 Tax=Sphingomonas montanisoli TaxID=2606412 RepID=A0A5D9C2Z2_9SPHN|nr:DUF2254 domain-containing protein [Sphingomonas montanisoli]TZG25823.1 DUF2254 domain-containing protein [Sphingomonas montanisoli]